VSIPIIGRTREKGVEALHRDEGIQLERFHELAQRHDIGLHCSRCGQMFQGQNSPESKYFVISCNCRELKWDSGVDGARH
jgi:hypothetical protein